MYNIFGWGSSEYYIKYIIVNAHSFYNLLVRRPSYNKLGAIVSTMHLKLKLPSPDGKVMPMKLDQKVAHKCYENSLRNW